MKSASFARRYAYLRTLVDCKLASLVKRDEPHDLAEASRYVLTASGKRVRATLLLLACESVGGRIESAVDAAAAVEMLHNFTLVHDDVMDNAASRRGRATVHTKWDVNHAILVGDVILGLAYRSLLGSTRKITQRAVELFTEALIGVCRGQAFDLEFERRDDISMKDYYRMIDMKTGKVIATATELGALLGNGTQRQRKSLRKFGEHIGRAFQIQDDLLDLVANEKHFGKRIGGDIIEGKKTFLLVHAVNRATGSSRATLRQLMTRQTRPLTSADQRKLVQKVTTIYNQCGVVEAARGRIKHETATGLRALQGIPRGNARTMLQWFSEMLVQRSS